MRTTYEILVHNYKEDKKIYLWDMVAETPRAAKDNAVRKLQTNGYSFREWNFCLIEVRKKRQHNFPVV